ncbi:hypothetical protein B9Z45_08090 [Limnohabitans sp. 2KL-17]|uniref:hypothetical protein n=1 Tax=Limnohabitans sp. 2KL-17 TaxID=1100704 RepID=UPI000D386E2E|nr:hypothetical protein [Limnohabitans sp. 2KL-17]PUE57369.1 hypothetical protein B9Z45_08090 [Limnohabitans sp. 2KL-17]
MPKLTRLWPLVALLLLQACSSLPPENYAPKLGQMGKDVMWLPTRDELVTQLLTAAQVSPEDEVVDLGAGDGKIPIAAARQFGARAWGIEYNKDLAALAQRNGREWQTVCASCMATSSRKTFLKPVWSPCTCWKS